MDEEERTETEGRPADYAALSAAPEGQQSYAVLYKREPLPWVLFVATLVIFIASTLVLVNKANSTERRAEAANDAQLKAEKRLNNELDPLKDKIQELTTEVKTVTAEREALADKLKAMELKALDSAKPAPAKKAPPPPPAKKKPPPAKKKKK